MQTIEISEEVFEVPVVIFAMDERTKNLSEYFFKRLGYKKVILFDENEGFSQKMKKFFELSTLKEFENDKIFIRSDADRLVFSGMLDLTQKTLDFLESRKDGLVLAEGSGYECFMRTLRGATPHIYSSLFMKKVLESEESLIIDVQKPESHIGKHAKDVLNCFFSTSDITNFHEFEQYPSKMVNAFLNRINRGHIGYYDVNQILGDEFYGSALELAIQKSKEESKSTMSYDITDLNILQEKDKLLNPIFEEKFEDYYQTYNEAYKNLRESLAR
jgi:hypothetical protein